MKRSRTSQRGFTLLELIVAMVISAILAGMIAMIIGAPVDSYLQQGRNSELSEASDRIAGTLTADFSRALPNSVRIRNVGVRSVVQMLEVMDVVYFVPQGPDPTQAPVQLDTAVADSSFSALGSFANSDDNNVFLVVNNTVTSDVYRNVPAVRASAIVPAGTTTSPNTISLSPAFRFANGAPPTNRMFVVRRTPITYICNRGSGLLQRYANHAIGANIPTNESAAQLNSLGTQVTVVATGVTGCSVTCGPGPANQPCRNTLTVSMTLRSGVAPQTSTVRVLHQVPVGNTP